ncbi:uncharacterized protein LOC143918609 [Arctopsyche grandis]|uniref:uncharacterized protein LOC143918609 n=1 Tax=Arctopsyche grandis TaxID=121162 RepID=UPI00406D6F92
MNLYPRILEIYDRLDSLFKIIDLKIDYRYVKIRYLDLLNEEIETTARTNNLDSNVSTLSLGDGLKYHIVNRMKITDKISLYWEIYSQICEACNYINRGLNDDLNRSSHYSMFIFSIHQIMLQIISMTIPVFICNCSKLKANKTAVLINKMMMNESNDALATKLHQISTHMLHTSPNFSASGLFAIDNSLIFTIIGATTTYLIILIQFAAM